MNPSETDALEYGLGLLERSIAGETTPADELALAAWIERHPEYQPLVAALRAHGTTPAASHDVDAAWTRMAARIRRAAKPAVLGSITPAGEGRSAWRIAAAAIVLAVLGWGAFRALQPKTPEPRVYASAARQRLDLRLGDRTHVILAPESRLRVASDFGKERRDIYLEGEAYFEVVHDSTRPFTVFAANASTRDVGTAFAMRSYPEDRAVRVVVREGSVALSGAGLLAAGDVGRLTADGQASVRHHADVGALLAWTAGPLVFRDAPLGQVLGDLRRWYGIDAELRDSTLRALPFTGSLQQTSPSSAIALVAATLGLRVRAVDTHFVLEKP
ncbi:MAG TPA: FecR domain-containing protein [Gemmatimonadales bacterium]|nr:FecR domain-containing protein [Gemmatimonadales bacterium]